MPGKSGFDYKGKRWEKCRARALRAAGYLCQESLRYGIQREATIVHHVWPVEQFPEFAFADWNLLPLCAEAHDRMHDRASGKLTATGESWRRRRSPPPSPSEKTL